MKYVLQLSILFKDHITVFQNRSEYEKERLQIYDTRFQELVANHSNLVICQGNFCHSICAAIHRPTPLLHTEIQISWNRNFEQAQAAMYCTLPTNQHSFFRFHSQNYTLVHHHAAGGCSRNCYSAYFHSTNKMRTSCVVS